jgi:hypothetical protein
MSRSKAELQRQYDALKGAGANITELTDLDKVVSQKRSFSRVPSYRGSPQKGRLHRYPYHAPKHHEDHKFGKPLTCIPKSYTTDVLNFVGYLANTAKRTFTIEGIDRETGEKTLTEKPYIHRWTEIYARGFYAKMYQLENALEDDIRNVTMVTLSMSHRGRTAEECMLELREKWKKLRQVLWDHFGTVDFFRTFEPHASGFPHMHVLYMRTITLEEQSALKKLWSDKYGMGNRANGIHFLAPRASSDGHFKAGAVAKIRGYLIKYVGKCLYPKDDGPDYDYKLRGKTYKLKYSPKMLLFNALLKKTKTRLWGASRNFSKIMAPLKEMRPNWECLCVTQKLDGEVVNTICDKENGSYPDEGHVQWKRDFEYKMSFSCRPIAWATEEEIKARKEYEASLPPIDWEKVNKHRVG